MVLSFRSIGRAQKNGQPTNGKQQTPSPAAPTLGDAFWGSVVLVPQLVDELVAVPQRTGLQTVDTLLHRENFVLAAFKAVSLP